MHCHCNGYGHSVFQGKVIHVIVRKVDSRHNKSFSELSSEDSPGVLG